MFVSSGRPFSALSSAVCKYSCMSSVHRVFGRPDLGCACNRMSIVGSHLRTSFVQSNESVRASLCAHVHFRLRCIVIQSSSFRFFIFCSASCVHRLIHSVHGSMLVVCLSSTCLGGIGNVDVVLFVSSSLSVDGSRFVCFSCACFGTVVSVMSVRRGECRIIRSICRCVLRNRFSSSNVSVQASAPYKIVGVMTPWNNRNRSDSE